MRKFFWKIGNYIVSHILLLYFLSLILLGILCWKLSVFQYFIDFWIICAFLVAVFIILFLVYEKIEQAKVKETEFYDKQEK